MSNLYTLESEFRLVDVDGVLLTAGQYIVIREPDGMDKAMISLKRSQYHGVDFEFFDADSVLGFDHVKASGQTYSGYDLLEAVFAADGPNGSVKFQYYRNATLIYDSKIIFSTRQKLDLKIVVTAERLNFDGDYQTRFDTEFNINKTTDLNGGSIGSVTYEEIVLPPQNVRNNLILKNDGLKVYTTSDLLDAQNFLPTFDEEVINTYPNVDATPLGTGNFIFDLIPFTEYGTYQIDIDFDFDFESDQNFTSVQLIIVVSQDKYQYQTGATTSNTPAISVANEALRGSGTATTNYNINTTKSYTFNANRGDILNFRIFLNGGGVTTPSYNYVIERNIRMQMIGDIRSKYLGTSILDIKTALTRHFRGITGVNNALTSTFLDAQNSGLISGRLVRGFPNTEPFRLQSKKAIDSLQAIFGLGAFVKENEIIIERYSYFYQDAQIIAITSNIADFEITTDKNLIPNEVGIGYKTFSDVQDAPLVVDSNTDNLTQHQYLTSIKRDKKKVDFLSDWIASGYVISEGKQLSYGLYPDEKWKEDESTFIVARRTTDTLFSQTIQIIRLLDGSYADTDQYKLVVENYLPFAPGDYTDLTIDGTTYTVGFSDNPEGLSVPVIPDEDQNITTFYITDDLALSAGGGVKDTLTDEDITLDFTFESVETNEAFSTLSGVPFAFATYNARYNIKYMLFNNSPILNSGFNWDASGKYTLTSFENNADMQTQLAIGEDESVLDPDRLSVTQSADLDVSDANGGDQLFIPEILTFRTRLSYEQILDIKNAHYDDMHASYYGYISVTPYDGVTYKGFLREMSYNPITEMVKFTLIRKYDGS